MNLYQKLDKFTVNLQVLKKNKVWYNAKMVDSIENISTIIEPILKKYSIKYAGIFGSYARGEARADSDVDILVSLPDQTFTLFDMMNFKEEISEQLKKPVDVVSDRAIVSYFRDYIYKDLKPIYEKR